MKNKQKIIIDCDPGIDDTLAIALVFGSRLFDISVVTVVAGNSTIFNTCANARYVLDKIGAFDVPVYSGEAKPLARNLVIASVHGQEGLGDFVVPKVDKLSCDAVLRLRNEIYHYPGEITILALGPLTNIAKLLLRYPKVAPLISNILIMGGAVYTPGNKTFFAEFNFFVDPEAAQIVLAANIKKVLIPLNVCNKTGFDISGFDQFESMFIRDLVKSYQRALKTYENIDKIIVYDAVAAYYLINPLAFITKSLRLSVETQGAKSGQVLILGGKPNVNVAMDINAKRFKEDFLKILKGGEKYDRT